MIQHKTKMFKNPLKKYQQGGQVSQEQQQMLAAFVEWLPKRVQEFQGMKPEQIVEALNGMTKSPEGQKQVQAYMQQFQQEMQNSQAGMFENGGKLQDFICKHAKGGHVADCGCKEDGGKVEKAQNGTSGIPQNASALDTYLMSNMQMPNSSNLFTGQQVANLINGIHLNQPLVQAQEDGGKVKKAEDGYKVKNGSYEASVKAPGDTTRSKQYNYTTENMRTYPTGAVRYQTISNNDGYTTTSWDYRKTMPTFWQRIGSEGFLSTLLNRPRMVSPTTKENWENIIVNHPEDPRNALKKESGGVVKGQEGLNIPAEAPSTGEIRPDSTTNPIRRWIDNKINNNSTLRNLSRGFRNFGNSAMGKALGFFMPDFNNGAVGAVTPGFKVIPEGKVGSLRRQNYDPFIWEVMANDPVVKENARKLGIKEGSKEWAKFLESENKKLFDLINK